MSNPDILLQALRVITRTMCQQEFLRDQIMGHLHSQGVSLRTIADYADMDHSTVAKKCRAMGDTLEDLEVLMPTRVYMIPPGSDIIDIQPERIISQIIKGFSKYEPVKPEELERIARDLDGLWNLSDELSPPAWPWMLVQVQSILNHCEYQRASLLPEECASSYRRGILAQQWRIQMLQVDVLASMRQRWMNVLGASHRRGEQEGVMR